MVRDRVIRARVPARIGLLGNPSDGYGGRVIACTLEQFAATVAVEPDHEWCLSGVDAGASDPVVVAQDVAELVDRCRQYRGGGTHGFAPGAELLGGAVVAFADLLGVDGGSALHPCRFEVTTSIPRQVGLSGSSAIVIGALRGLADLHDHVIGPVELARLALEVETDVLGGTAGPQDRVVQVHGGVMDMDFASPWNAEGYRRIDPALVPAMVVAWQRKPGRSSTVVHSDVRARWDRGDPLVHETMDAFAELAAKGAVALQRRDAAEFAGLVDAASGLRERIWHLEPTDVALVAMGRSLGAGTVLTGSGGAVVAVPRDGDADRLAAAFRSGGHEALVVKIGAPSEPVRDPDLASSDGVLIPNDARLRPVILAAGFGSRLAPLTDSVPKPLLVIGDRPLVGHLVARLADVGLEAPVIVVNGRHPDQFREWSAQASVGAVRILDNGVTQDDRRPGAVRDLAAALAASPAEGTDGWLVVAGDNLVAAEDLEAMRATWRRHRGPVVGCRVLAEGDRRQFGEVTVDDDGRIIRFREKPPDPTSPIAATCTYALPADTPALIESYLGAGGDPDSPGRFVGWLSRRRNVQAQLFDHPYHDIGTHATLAEARAAFDGAGPSQSSDDGPVSSRS